MIANVRVIADLPVPTGTSPCPVCRRQRRPRVQFGHGWVWSCATFACVVREVAGHYDPCDVPAPRQLPLWTAA